jgi:hypothetical protein
MRYLVFKNDETSKRRYQMLYLALVNSERRNSREDLRTITDLTRTLREVGEEDGKVGAVAVYDLKENIPEDGVAIALEGAEYKMMSQLIDATRWSSGVAIDVVDVMDWLSNAPRDRPRAADVVDEQEPEMQPAEESHADAQG